MARKELGMTLKRIREKFQTNYEKTRKGFKKNSKMIRTGLKNFRQNRSVRNVFEKSSRTIEKNLKRFETDSSRFRNLFDSSLQVFLNSSLILFELFKVFRILVIAFATFLNFLRFLDCIYTSMYILQRQASMVLLTLNSNKYQFYLYSPSRNISVSYLYESRKCIAHNYKFVVLVANLASEINAPIGCVGWT